MAARTEDLYIPRVRSERPRVRFTRKQVHARRRLVASVVAFVIFLSLFMLATGPEGSAQASRSGAPKVVSMQPGQSLWDLAERYAADGTDPRAYVDALIRINEIEGYPLIGERLKLPR